MADLFTQIRNRLTARGMVPAEGTGVTGLVAPSPLPPIKQPVSSRGTSPVIRINPLGIPPRNRGNRVPNDAPLGGTTDRGILQDGSVKPYLGRHS
jgi:hypothetical protein